jgi:hypothetical protein
MLWSIRDFENWVDVEPLLGVLHAARPRRRRLPAVVEAARCANCYGTTFEGGIRAHRSTARHCGTKNVRSLEDVRERGHTVVASGSVQVTSDFNMRDGDYLVPPGQAAVGSIAEPTGSPRS